MVNRLALPNYNLKQPLDLLRVVPRWQKSQICGSNQNQWEISLDDKEKGRAGALENQVSRAFPELPKQSGEAEEAAFHSTDWQLEAVTRILSKTANTRQKCERYSVAQHAYSQCQSL